MLGEALFRGHPTWPQKLLVFGALGALLTLFVAVAAVFSVTGTVRTGHQLRELSIAQRYHQDADMMHDALRADVVSAQQVGRGSSPTLSSADVLRSTQAHARQLDRDLNELRTLELPTAVASALESMRRPREVYRERAVGLVRSALSGAAPNPARQTAFQELFDSLALRQSEVTTQLADTSSEVEETQQRRERDVARVLVGASAVAIAGWGFLVAILRRAGVRLAEAVDREAEQRAVAEQLRRSLLPGRLPVLSGVRVAARSRPKSAMRVGGDWYDVIALPSGDVGLVVGDVVGHDLVAATAMGQLRASLRAFAVYEPSPAAVLTRVNMVAGLLEVTDLTTCLYAVVSPHTRAVRWASAGHLNPLVVTAAGKGELLRGSPGPPIGVDPTAEYVDRTFRMDRSGSLVLYTDGLVERRSEPISDGLARLESITGAHTDPDRLCDEFLEVLLDDDAPVDDDVTLLALQA
jgi:serine phosphatase RsbU (regulator of sigma subunit)